jgi:hypothetical protein
VKTGNRRTLAGSSPYEGLSNPGEVKEGEAGLHPSDEQIGLLYFLLPGRDSIHKEMVA